MGDAGARKRGLGTNLMRGRTRLCAAASHSRRPRRPRGLQLHANIDERANRRQVPGTAPPARRPRSRRAAARDRWTSRPRATARGRSPPKRWVTISGEPATARAKRRCLYGVAESRACRHGRRWWSSARRGCRSTRLRHPVTFTLNRTAATRSATAAAGSRLMWRRSPVARGRRRATPPGSRLRRDQSGAASATVALSVAPNAGAARVGHVNVGGQNYTINQDAAPVARRRRLRRQIRLHRVPRRPPLRRHRRSPTPAPAPAPGPTPSPAPSTGTITDAGAATSASAETRSPAAGRHRQLRR